MRCDDRCANETIVLSTYPRALLPLSKPVGDGAQLVCKEELERDPSVREHLLRNWVAAWAELRMAEARVVPVAGPLLRTLGDSGLVMQAPLPKHTSTCESQEWKCDHKKADIPASG